ncbi:hypothetical protein HMN09_00930600 [Mycena chlorophos]|uniref:Uncharacterized protein n=1 Tax=Mycena chlorophos TaxID=658473 RepID=A0A8H6W2E5_MYCCL|nr:hypothetical protein HMN09_00930600 [Mycena chlorophos]
MTGKTWLDDAQANFLAPFVPGFIEHQAAKKLRTFHRDVHRQWFAQFPEEAAMGWAGRVLSDEEKTAVAAAKKTREGQIETYLRREADKRLGKKRGAKAQAPSPAVTAVQGRTSQAIEVFQRKFHPKINNLLMDAGWTELNEAAVAEEDTDEVADEAREARIKAASAERLALRRNVVAEAWKNATDEEKAAVQEELEKEIAQRKARAVDGESLRSTTPAEYQSGVDGAPLILEEAHKALALLAGASGYTVYACPSPENHGQVLVRVECFGEKVDGLNFVDYHPTFKQDVMSRFDGFATRTYPPEERQRRALPDDLIPEEHEQDAPAAPIPRPKRMKKPKTRRTDLPTLPDAVVIPVAVVASSPVPASVSTPVSTPIPTVAEPAALIESIHPMLEPSSFSWPETDFGLLPSGLLDLDFGGGGFSLDDDLGFGNLPAFGDGAYGVPLSFTSPVPHNPPESLLGDLHVDATPPSLTSPSTTVPGSIPGTASGDGYDSGAAVETDDTMHQAGAGRRGGGGRGGGCGRGRGGRGGSRARGTGTGTGTRRAPANAGPGADVAAAAAALALPDKVTRTRKPSKQAEFIKQHGVPEPPKRKRTEMENAGPPPKRSRTA